LRDLGAADHPLQWVARSVPKDVELSLNNQLGGLMWRSIIAFIGILVCTDYAIAAANSPDDFKKSLLAIKASPPVVKDDFTLNPDVLKVSSDKKFPDQVQAHQENLGILQKLNNSATDNFDHSKSIDVVREATKLRDSMLPFAFTYQISSDRAKKLKEQGYLLSNINKAENVSIRQAAGSEPKTTTAKACNAQGQCADVDPIVALFMIAINALTQEFKKEKPFGPNNEITKAIQVVAQFVAKPAGGDHSAFVLARSVIIPQNDQGEIAKLLRDPVRRPIELSHDPVR
jgi:hypothetical protein